MIRIFRYLWAFPATALGLPMILVAWLSGGRVAIVRGAIEIHGGLVGKLLRRGVPMVGPAAAMTLGHVILGQNLECLETSRDHEHVHVRQYERWGPFMLPIYLVASLFLYLRGYDGYLDNPFEREAFALTDGTDGTDR